jgi:hypothetical protein
MTLHAADYLAHVSNLLLLVSYSVRDMLWLRWFAVAAAFIIMPYYLWQPQILWPPVLWGSVFAAINLVQIARIYAERRPVVLAPEEQKLYDLSFSSLRPREFLSLALIGEWKDAEPGDQLLKRGERVASLAVAVAGSVEVTHGQQVVGTIPPGQVVGTALALVGEPSPVDARFRETGRYLSWPLSSLRVFIDKHPDLRLALQQMVSRDVSRKVEGLVRAAT